MLLRIDETELDWKKSFYAHPLLLESLPHVHYKCKGSMYSLQYLNVTNTTLQIQGTHYNTCTPQIQTHQLQYLYTTNTKEMRTRFNICTLQYKGTYYNTCTLQIQRHLLQYLYTTNTK